MLDAIRSLLSPSYRKKKHIERAAVLAGEFIETAKNILSRRSISRVEQLKYLEDNRDTLFGAFEVLADASPIQAIQKLLELGESLQEKARPYFWREVQTPIGKLLKNLPEGAKKSVYLKLLKSAPEGTITDFIIDHAEDFVAMITSPKTTANDNIFELLRKHTAPRTADFIEKIRPLFLEIYQQRSDRPGEKLVLFKKLLTAYDPRKANFQTRASSNFIEEIKAEHIKSLVCKIGELYADEKGDRDFKGTALCLQELEALQACNSPFLEKARSERSDKAPAFFRLYKLSVPDSTPLYILTTKEKGRGNPDEGGKISIVLMTPDIESIPTAFSAINNIQASRGVVQKLAQHYATKTAPKLRNTFAAADTPPYSITYHHPVTQIPGLSYSFELTGHPKGVNSRHNESYSHPLNRDNVPVEQYQERAL